MIYAILVHVLRWNLPESEHVYDAWDFHAVISGPHSPLRNRYTIYAKIRNHLRCFGSCFTLKSVWVRTRSRWDARDFYAVIFGPHSPFQYRSTIYAKIRNHLRCFGLCFTLNYVRVRTRSWWDAPDFYAVIFGPHLPFRNRSTIYAKICNHLRCFGSCFTLKSVRVRTVPDGTHAGTGRGYTWLGLPGTNGSPGLPLPRPYIYIYSLYIWSHVLTITRGSSGSMVLFGSDGYKNTSKTVRD
jgi:hypothetical protein